MLSGEGNKNGEKTTIGLIRAKKQLCTYSTLFFNISLPLFCTTTTWNFQKLFVGSSFSSLSHAQKINSVDLFWLHPEFRCVTCTSKNAVSPGDSTIASQSNNMEGGSALLVLTRKQEVIAQPFPSVPKQLNSLQDWIFLTVAVTAAVTLFAHTFRLNKKQRYHSSQSKGCAVMQTRSLCLNIQIAQ